MKNIQKEWRKFQDQLELIQIYIDPILNFRSIPFAELYLISIHSPYKLPDFNYNNFKFYNHETTTTIKYFEQRIKRLGKGYDTDCFSYDSDTNFNYYRMRSDCLNDCY